MRRILILPLALTVASVAACSSSGSKATPTASAGASSGAASSATAPLSSGAPAAPGSASTGSSAGGATTQASPQATETNTAGDIPDNTVYVPFQQPGASYVVSVPEGWARSTAGSTTTFTDKLNSIAVTSSAVAAAPTVDSAKQTTVPQLQKAGAKFTLVGVTTVQRKGGPAVLVHYQIDSAPNPVTNKVIRDDVQRYEFFHNGTEVDLTLTGPVSADNVDPWKTVTGSLQWK